MINKFSVFLVILIFSSNVFAKSDLWRKQMEKIKLLVTVESDVEKILGKPTERNTKFGEYETKDGVFTIRYSEGNCKEDLTAKYDVERGTVIEYNFSPRKKIKFPKLGINTSGLPTSKTGDVYPPTITYKDLANGVNYDVNWEKLLIWVQVYPPDSFDYLRCNN